MARYSDIVSGLINQTNRTITEARIRFDREQQLMGKIDEMGQENIFIKRAMQLWRSNDWSQTEVLAQMVVWLAENNNQLQDDLLKHEYAKAYPEPVVTDEDTALAILENAIVELKLARSERC